ncbi:MMPL family transporter [Corynebacterium sp. 319]|uniref:MMPL family transporter n=1 Tax=unclassified Corynebacterium TaxID=2624378 RepID=UPI00125CB54A|nr:MULTISPECIES: MMPL family transporter [unclassified Corynebacterium]KAB1552825.1 MMPL family transporter [Corynebacterium sp. 321]KAB1553957.1 MMPL family transporter [Corynebacterium sp. 319]KAB3540300.1 MMPL family transporter [Corynebacterium sp. 366]
MAQFLYRLGRSAYAHKWRFLAAWLILIIGVGTAAATLQKPTDDNFTIPGLESVDTMERLQEEFPNAQGQSLDAPTGTLVIKAPDGKTLADESVAKTVDHLLEQLKNKDYLANTDELVSPVMAAQGMTQQLTEAKKAQGMPEEQIAQDIAALSPLSEDQRIGTISVTFTADSSADVPLEDKEDFAATVEANQGDLTAGWSGNAFQNAEMDMTSELIGLAVAAIVLIATFGAFVAAGLPLVTAVIGVAMGTGLVFASTAFIDSVSSMTPTLASMIGLAVGIDYALFILARFRNELVAHVGGQDLSPKELAAKLKTIPAATRAHLAGLAVGKAGSAVVFAGLTVLIALSALSIIGIPFLTTMALSAALTVALAVIISVSLLPAIMSLLGTKLFAGRAPIVKAPDPENEAPTMGLKWVRMIRARPWIFAIASVALLAVLAIPATNLRLAMPTDGTMAKGSPNRVAYEMTEEGFGAGRNAPMIALVEYGDAEQAEAKQAVLTKALETFQSTDGIANAQLAATNGDPANPQDLGTAAQIMITPKYGATDERAADVLDNLRAHEASFETKTGGTFAITGITPMFEDISQQLQDALIPYISIVLVLAFLLLMVVFRSIWVPLLAALGFGLSVAATFGVTVGLWQEGMLGLIDDPQPLVSFLPIMLIGIVFGLAMDYQVFLVTRMREGWAHGKTAENATANGFKHGARVVTAAALIMISVFAAFTTLDQPFIKVMGFALAVAVFFDAFIVRMVLIPATMFLLGERAWAIPRWLDKIIPSVDVEGESLQGLSESDAQPATPTAHPES